MRQMYIDYYNNNSFDVMCMPTTPSTAPPIYSVEPYMLFNGQYLPNRVSALCARAYPIVQLFPSYNKECQGLIKTPGRHD